VKVSLLAWRLFQNRLPTKDNLFRRGIIPQEAQLCMGGCGEIETTNHLFSKCNYFNSVWHRILNWIGISTVEPYGISWIILFSFIIYQIILGDNVLFYS